MILLSNEAHFDVMMHTTPKPIRRSSSCRRIMAVTMSVTCVSGMDSLSAMSNPRAGHYHTCKANRGVPGL